MNPSLQTLLHQTEPSRVIGRSAESISFLVCLRFCLCHRLLLYLPLPPCSVSIAAELTSLRLSFCFLSAFPFRLARALRLRSLQVPSMAKAAPSAPSAPRPKRTQRPSSKVIDPANAADAQLRFHKVLSMQDGWPKPLRLLEVKIRQDQSGLDNRSSVPTSPTTVTSFPEPPTTAKRVNPTIGAENDSDNDHDLIRRRSKKSRHSIVIDERDEERHDVSEKSPEQDSEDMPRQSEALDMFSLLSRGLSLSRARAGPEPPCSSHLPYKPSIFRPLAMSNNCDRDSGAVSLARNE
ncbi:hypothetical protein BJV78DRAFT_707216 [Lactifluus subvellereus]|nr:hypothetical protein BJV78DRAFT_707216 [Lactifluus subvellereus]